MTSIMAPNSAPPPQSTETGQGSNYPIVMYSGPSVKDASTERFVRQYVMRAKKAKPRGRAPVIRDPKPREDFEHGGSASTEPLRIPMQSKISFYQIGWLGAGRADPFQRFPIEMDSKSMELVEHSKFRTLFSHQTTILDPENKNSLQLYLWCHNTSTPSPQSLYLVSHRYHRHCSIPSITLQCCGVP